MFPPTERIKGV